MTVKKIRLYGLFVVLAVSAVYVNTMDSPFLFDDYPHIIGNPVVHDLSQKNIYTQPGGLPLRPFSFFTFFLNYQMSGLEVWSYHVTSTFIHIIAALALFGIVRRTFLTKRLKDRYGEHAAELGLVCSLCWGLHPIHTQAVTYLSQRMESLMGMFFLLTVYCAIRGWQSADKTSATAWHLGAIFSCLLGVFSKEVTGVAPFMVLLYGWLFIHTGLRESFKKSKLLYSGLAGCFLVLVGYFQLAFSFPTQYSRYDYALMQVKSVWVYIKLTFWPSPLIFDYVWPQLTLTQVLPGLVFFLACVGITGWGVYARKLWSYPVAWFFMILAPTSSLFPLAFPVFEYRVYLSQAGLVVLAVLAAYELGHYVLGKLSLPSDKQRALGNCLALVCVLGVCACLGVATLLRNLDYSSESALWGDTVAKHPENHRAQNWYGLALVNLNRPAEALEPLKEALRLVPDYGYAHWNMARALVLLERGPEALPHFERAVESASEKYTLRKEYGLVLFELGQKGKAKVQFEEALKLKPNDSFAKEYMEKIEKQDDL